MFGIWCSAQVPQTGGGEGGTQKRPHSVLTVVHEVGLGLLDIEVNGIGGAVGDVEVLPRVLVAGLRAVLLARHPDGKAGVIEPEAVERAGEAQLFDGGAQVAEEGVEVHGREPQRHYGQHHSQQGGTFPHAHLRQADTGKHQQDGRKGQRAPPALLVAEQVEGAELVERCGVHGDGNADGLRHG